ncbi:MAG: N-acetyl-gamma-glutamyl-phosphate reductase [Natronincolaceae bacterium]|jgi:N-acetyl-gamma-glutamyl-phosphate reductase|nr:N-acetyl-gamma-glutamyl-phosphate reductase [Bacillota bacterium]NLK89991.1 N-acetyl-gamma-glutamyl-phosphate reductase [Clostridiales bacterium]
MLKVGIIGATGYAGGELVRLVSNHSELEISFLDSRSYASVEYSKIYPNFKNIVDNKCISINLEKDLDEIDVFFIALPHGLSQGLVKKILEKNKKVIDLSADFRLRDVDTYEEWYTVKHEAKELLVKAVYGLCEIYADRIREADLVANPGCYPTSVILPLYPLLKERLIDSDIIIVDAKSGVSGAGRSVKDANLFSQCNENLRAYGIGTHRHTPEIEQELSTAAGKRVMAQFTPHLAPMTRGILSTIYLTNNKKVKAREIRDTLEYYYKNQQFIRILEEGEYPQTKAVYGSNYCDIGFKMDERTNTIVVVSAIDNLVKGAAGQAVQNMNLMFGFDIDEGLKQPPVWP